MTERSRGYPEIDDALAGIPETLTSIAPYQRPLGYKCWKIPGRDRNWLQWNDGGTLLPITFPNRRGKVRTWKLFARFGTEVQLRGPWDRPERYERKKNQWMPAGPDVWGCSYESLRAYLDRVDELQALLRQDLELAYRYSIQRYGERE